MNPPSFCRRIRNAIVACLALVSVQAAFASDLTISTTTIAYGGPSSYTVPTGANYLKITAWGAVGYIIASYDVKPGDTCSIKLVGGNGGNTTVGTPNGTIHITGGPGNCTASGSAYNVTNLPSGGPPSPGAANKYQGYVIIVAMARPPTITSPTTATVGLGHSFSYTITSTGGATKYNASGLPSGLSINTTTGVISGTPTVPGQFTVTLSASNGATSTQPLALSVTPVITSNLTASGKENEPFSYTVAASGSPSGFSATGLPSGLSINPNTGVISGSATQSGTFTVQISATSSGATGSATLALTMAPTFILTITSSTPQGGTTTGAGIYDPGTTATIVESANPHFRAAGWGGTDSGSVASPGSASSTIVMSANRSLVAQFVAIGTLTVNAASGGTAGGGGTFDVGSVQPITAAPTGNNIFTGWSGAGIANADAGNSTIVISGDETITAGFAYAVVPTPQGTAVFPNAVSSGQAGITPTTQTIQVVLTNNGATNETVSTLTISTVTTTGDFAPTVNLPLIIPPGGSVSITVTFDPTQLGPRTGVLTAVTDSTTTPVIQYDLQGQGVNPNWPPSANVYAPPTAYSLSPLTVSGAAMAPNNNLTLQSLEWQAPGDGSWTVKAVPASGGNANQTSGITFPTVGLWNVRAGVSIDNGTTWYYSPVKNINIINGITNYTLETMAVPAASVQQWYAPSPVAQKTYEVQHFNP